MRNYKTILAVIFAILVMFVFMAAIAKADTVEVNLHLGKGDYTHVLFSPTPVQITIYNINNQNADVAIATGCRPGSRWKKVAMRQVAPRTIYVPKPPGYLRSTMCGFAVYNNGEPTNLTINFSSETQLDVLDNSWPMFVGWSKWAIRNYLRNH